MANLDHFIAQQRAIYPLSDETARILVDEMEEISVSKGDFLIWEGERDPYVWFVKEGLVRAFVERDKRDITLWFASAGEIVNMAYRNISAYNLEMVEETQLLRISASRLESLCEQTLDLANWMRKLLDYYLREYENYFINDSWSDAREQYETLLRTRPDLFQRVPLKHIASYLQITPQSLSRIRSSVK